MMLVGVLVNYVDPRLLLAFGFAGFGYSTLLLSHINLGIAMSSVAVPNFMNGFAGGFIFVPLTMLSMGVLRKQEMGNASGVYNLLRNVGGSVGIAAVTTSLVRGSQKHQNYLAANLTPGSAQTDALLAGLGARFHAAGADAVTSHQMAFGAIYRLLAQQSSLLAYADNFRMIGYLALCSLPLVFLLVRPRHQRPGDSKNDAGQG
jgi:DHA2 family multidrug resistance protein